MQANTTIPNFRQAPRAEAENNVHADLYYRDDKVVAAVLWRGVEPMPFLCLQDSLDGGIATFTLVSDGDVPRFDRRQTITELNASILRSERTQPGGARVDEIVGLSLTKPGEAAPHLVLAGNRPQVAPERAPYGINDMDAAVEYAKKTRQLFREGKHAEAFAHYQQDPLGGASKETAITTQDRFVALMYSMRDVQGEPLFPQPDGYALGDLAVGMKVQLAEGEKWQRVRHVIEFEGLGSYVMVDGSPTLHKDADLAGMYNEPSVTQYAAVLGFSEKYGRQWKDRLMDVWTKGDYSKRGIDADQAALLQQVRNECGPEWLANAKLDRKVEFDIWGNDDSQITARRACQRFADDETPPDGYTNHLIRVDAANGREAVKLYHAALKESDAEVQYTVSIHSESWNEEAREAGEPQARAVELDAETLTLDELVREAKKYGIDSVSSPTLADPYVWFKSSSPAEDREHFEAGTDKYFSLHVQAVGGKEPTTEHYADLAGKFGIKLAPRHYATADSDNAL